MMLYCRFLVLVFMYAHRVQANIATESLGDLKKYPASLLCQRFFEYSISDHDSQLLRCLQTAQRVMD